MHFYTFTRSSFCSLWINNKQHVGDLRYNYPLRSTSLVTTMRIKVNMLSGAMAFMFSCSSSEPVSWGRTNHGSLEMTHLLLQNYPHLEIGKMPISMSLGFFLNICHDIKQYKYQHKVKIMTNNIIGKNVQSILELIELIVVWVSLKLQWHEIIS